MAKRLTDTEKWKDEWYLSLDNDYKIIWQYLLDSCSHSGLMKRGISLLNFSCKTNVTEQQLLEVFNKRVYALTDYYFIPKFIKFQYGDLVSDKPVIVSVIRGLRQSNDFKTIKQLLANHSIMIKDIDKSKDKDKSKIKCLFANSEFYDKVKFKDAFYHNPKYRKYDWEHYYESVKNWSGANHTMKADWILTAYNFARRDKEPKLITEANWK